MQFTEIEPNDLIQFTYHDDLRILHVSQVTTNGHKQYVEGVQINEVAAHRKFSWENVKDVSLIDRNVLKECTTLKVEPGFKTIVAGEWVICYKTDEKKPVKSGLFVRGNDLVDKDGNVLVSHLSVQVVEAFTG